MLNLQGLFGTQLEYHLSITTAESPSYTPKNKKSSSPFGEKPSKFIDKD